jgi:hypothetical protein
MFTFEHRACDNEQKDWKIIKIWRSNPIHPINKSIYINYKKKLTRKPLY